MDATSLFSSNLPDGIRAALFDERTGGLFLAGYDSINRATLLLYAPPYGQRLRTVANLPYRDYMRYTPTVLADFDTQRRAIYLLNYHHPLAYGSERMSLFRVFPDTGVTQLLAETASPYWEPAAMVSRSDGSVLVALGGLGPLLSYDACNDTACLPPRTVVSAVSNSTGKTSMVDLDGQLYLVVGSDPFTGGGGALVYEEADGTLGLVSWAADVSGVASRDSSTSTNDVGANVLSLAGTDGNTTNTASTAVSTLANPQSLAPGPHGSLLVLTHEPIDEFGYAQGSLVSLEPRARSGAAGCESGPCWASPQTVVSSLSNPRGVTLDERSGRIFIVEQHSIRMGSYEPFTGDVLSLCVEGRYTCAAGQNPGECRCVEGYGGPCCDLKLGRDTISAVLAMAGSWAVAAAPVFAALALLRIGLSRRRSLNAGRRDMHSTNRMSRVSEAAGSARDSGAFEGLREPLFGGDPTGDGFGSDGGSTRACDKPAVALGSVRGSAAVSSRSSRGRPDTFALLHRALNIEVDTQTGTSPGAYFQPGDALGGESSPQNPNLIASELSLSSSDVYVWEVPRSREEPSE